MLDISEKLGRTRRWVATTNFYFAAINSAQQIEDLQSDSKNFEALGMTYQRCVAFHTSRSIASIWGEFRSTSVTVLPRWVRPSPVDRTLSSPGIILDVLGLIWNLQEYSLLLVKECQNYLKTSLSRFGLRQNLHRYHPRLINWRHGRGS